MTLLKRLKEDAVAKFETQIRVQYINQTDLENVIANTVTAVLDEIEWEVEDKINSLGNLTESYNEGTYEGLMTTKKIIKSKRTEI